MHSSTRFNLSEAEVEEAFVRSWEADTEIVAGGKVFTPRESQITIREGAALSENELRSMAAWLLIQETTDDVTDRFIRRPPGSVPEIGSANGEVEGDPRRIAVVHGRDTAAKDALFGFLRDLDLHPLEWTEVLRATGSAAPSLQTAVQKLFELAAAVVVLFTPDDEVRLHPDLVPADDHRGDGSAVCQARGNVLLEAGMALAVRPNRTVLVEIGVPRLPSDLEGLHCVRLDGTAQPLHDLAQRLESAGCSVNQSGTDWLRTARFAELSARTRLPSGER